VSDFHAYLFEKLNDNLDTLISHYICQLKKSNYKHEILDILNDTKEYIKKSSVCLLYYKIYINNPDVESVRAHTKELTGKRKMERNNIEYEQKLYAYSKYRNRKDNDIENFYGASPQKPSRLYKNFEQEEKGCKVKRTQGHEISTTAFNELVILNRYSIFDAINEFRLPDVKKISNTRFKEEYFPQISSVNDGIYYDIINMPCTNTPYFYRTMNLYALESNCAFEKKYLFAKALKSKKLNKNTKAQEIENFRYTSILSTRIPYGENSILIEFQDRLIMGYDEILKYYVANKINTEEILQVVTLMNYMIHMAVEKFLNEHHACLEKFEITEQAEIFFKNYIGLGQHINEKNLNEFEIRDFRALFRKMKDDNSMKK